MSDDANDVTKALAAFGAPSIRYHSFGQAQIKPSSVVLPRRAAPPAPEEAAPIVTRQEEPVAAPEILPTRSGPPLTATHPLVPAPAPEAPVLRQAEPTRAPLQAPTVAPPPRPLAEWAAPLTPATIRPVAAAPLVRSSAPTPHYAAEQAPPPTKVVPPLFPTAPPVPVSSVAASTPSVVTPQVAPPTLPSPSPVIHSTQSAHPPALVAATPSHVDRAGPASSQRSANPVPSRNLQDIFEYLISGPTRVGDRAGS